MKIEVNVTKINLFVIIILISLFGAMILVYSYNPSGTGGSPPIVGHSVDEMDWSKTIPSILATTLTANQICLGADCKTAWPAGGAGGLVSVSAINGILASTTSGAVTVSPNYSAIQARVIGTCPTGAIRSIDATGAVTCASASISSVAGSNGITATTAAGAVTVSPNYQYVQARVTGFCPMGAIKSIDSAGAVTCWSIPATICTYNGRTYSTGARCSNTITCPYPTDTYLECRADGSWLAGSYATDTTNCYNRC